MTKRDQGDAEAVRQATERAAEVEALRGASPRTVAARLFRGLDPDEDEGDPGVLARTAVLVSGRAMRGRLWNEARHLAGLAESYARLGERAGRAAASGATIETLPLPLLFEILFEGRDAVHDRFALWGDGPETEHYELRRTYWERNSQRAKDAERARTEADDQLRELEGMIRELGGTPPLQPWQKEAERRRAARTDR